ncbi:hypothetical protein ACFLWX_00300 [Chloroflexota bacterium]
MRRKPFFSVKECVEQYYYSERHVRWLIKHGHIQAQKVGRRYQIFVDQTKHKGQWFYTRSGHRVFYPPPPPRNFIWDMKRMGFIPVEQAAKERGCRVVVRKGQKYLDATSRPGFWEEVQKAMDSNG